MSPEPKISFVDHHATALTAGDYLAQVVQHVEVDGVAEAWAGPEQRLRVEGPRFGLAPSLISSTFPPAGSRGAYGAVLPHVVLARPTLPWERSADPAGHLGPDGAAPPWLALLVLHADGSAPLPEARAMTMADLARDAPGVRTYDLGPRDLAREPCQVLDLDAATWAQVAPTPADLPWLSHGRTVSDSDPVAVVMAHRLPHADADNVAHLVSLEGLIDPAHPDRLLGPPPGGVLRLVSLLSWRFTSDDPDATLAELLRRVDAGPLRLPPPPVGGHPAARLAVAHRAGYGLRRHVVRDGGTTASWYRGPLLPLAPDAAAPVPRLPAAAPASADALLSFDPAGLLDTSCAVAYELGRLLMLRTPEAAGALGTWRHDRARAAAARTERAGLQEALGIASPIAEAEPAARFPPAVAARLDALVRLEDVPVSHLLPGPAALRAEPGTLAFVALDPEWVAALLDGALAVGRPARGGEDEAVPRRAAFGPLEPVTGVLLRSSVVEGWPGLRLVLRDGAGAPLPEVRRAHVAPGVLLCLARGVVAEAWLAEPLEGMHSGFADGPVHYAKGPLDHAAVARRVGGDGRVDVAGLAGELCPGGTPAEFAQAMVQGVQSVRFRASA